MVKNYNERVDEVISNSKYALEYYRLENQVRMQKNRVLEATDVLDKSETIFMFHENKLKYEEVSARYKKLVQIKILLREKILDEYIDNLYKDSEDTRIIKEVGFVNV